MDWTDKLTHKQTKTYKQTNKYNYVPVGVLHDRRGNPALVNSLVCTRPRSTRGPSKVSLPTMSYHIFIAEMQMYDFLQIHLVNKQVDYSGISLLF